MRSNLKIILPEGFFPPPFPLRRTELGLEIPQPSDVHDKDDFPSLFLRQAINLKPLGENLPMNLPYDMYCPSVISDLQDRICEKCGLYFTAKSHLKPHKVLHQNERRGQLTLGQNEIESLFEVSMLNWNTVEKNNETSSQIPIIENLSEWLIQPWVITETTEDDE